MHVVITGASRGVGAELRRIYEAAGHEVTGTSRKGEDGLHAVEMTDAASITAFGKALAGKPVDLLVCNAGILPDRNETLDTGYPAEMWAEELAVNVTAPFLCVQALLPNLRAATGKIAIISSQMGSSTLAKGNSLIYRVSKAAALNLGLNLSTLLKSDGIPVGIYHPGWVRTDMGGTSAAISPRESAEGLSTRFADLSPGTTGCFMNWDGRPHAI
ncbi:short-chain dehydrogenase [Oceanicola sp. 22II-s10i]|uniref:SDR family NAD(P)-dependent oxidoreductase n=1 Tax=Oceanicola sp. 22II-s10i TaxID=1317116 RepID=UPI000B522148|nr:SDR family NAD(P)-dependent oxidoreductase [Oceanicola sp. 22II-s10i]OWU86452.1 short-chain dehydrogenase [Oceanicola sp. 22II-s10i]